ncbi:hypothetical protein ACOMHN_014462 [Nucella lapillus]
MRKGKKGEGRGRRNTEGEEGRRKGKNYKEGEEGRRKVKKGEGRGRRDKEGEEGRRKGKNYKEGEEGRRKGKKEQGRGRRNKEGEEGRRKGKKGEGRGRRNKEGEEGMRKGKKGEGRGRRNEEGEEGRRKGKKGEGRGRRNKEGEEGTRKGKKGEGSNGAKEPCEDPISWADGFLLVFSLTEPTTWACAQELLTRLRRAREDDKLPVAIAANKSDLIHLRRLESRDCALWATERGCVYREVSAGEEPDSVEEVFQCLCRHIRGPAHKKREKLSLRVMQKPAVAARVQIRQSLRNLAGRTWRSRTSTF